MVENTPAELAQGMGYGLPADPLVVVVGILLGGAIVLSVVFCVVCRRMRKRRRMYLEREARGLLITSRSVRRYYLSVLVLGQGSKEDSEQRGSDEVRFVKSEGDCLEPRVASVESHYNLVGYNGLAQASGFGFKLIYPGIVLHRNGIMGFGFLLRRPIFWPDCLLTPLFRRRKALIVWFSC